MVIVVVGLAAHASGLGGALVFDDLPAIRDNVTIRSLWPPWAALVPPVDSGVGGRPIANVSLALSHAVGGGAWWAHHAGNVLLHVASALLLCAIVRRLARSDGAGLAVALVWVVHPLTTASVTYLSQRTEVLMAFFHLLALFAFVRGAEPARGRWLGLSVLACALGMASKETMITAPVTVLLCDRAFVAGTWREAWARRRNYYVALAATWAVLAALMATSALSRRSVGFGLGVSPFDYALTEVPAVGRYAGLALWPAPLIFDYGPIYAGGAAAWFGAAVAIAVLVAVGRALARNTAGGCAVAMFFLLLAPTSSFVPVAEQPIAENRAYLPLAVVVAVAVIALRAALGRRALIALAMAVVALAALTVARNADYRSGETLWADTVAKRPENPRARFNYGVVLLDAGRAAEAALQLERAIALKPRDPLAQNSLGNALLTLERPAEAAARFAEAVQLNPSFARAWSNHGLALLRMGDAAGAVARFEAAVRLDPAMAEAHHGLGNAHFALDRAAAAIPHYEAALRLDPALADAHYSCGNACLEAGRADDAVRHLAAAARLKPADAEIGNLHGVALVRAGRGPEAIAEFERVLRLKPDYADARENLALVRRR